MTQPDPRDPIDEAIRANAPAPEGATVTGWALACELTDGARRWTARAHSGDITPEAAERLHVRALTGEWPDGDQ